MSLASTYEAIRRETSGKPLLRKKPAEFLGTGHQCKDDYCHQSSVMGLRGTSNCYIFNRCPPERCCGQIWHGVVKEENTYSYVISTGTRKLELPTL